MSGLNNSVQDSHKISQAKDIAHSEMEKDTHWTLQYGIIKGTLAIRDVATKSHKYRDRNSPLESLQDCQDLASLLGLEYAQMGYSIWLAHAIDPEGKKHLIS